MERIGQRGRTEPWVLEQLFSGWWTDRTGFKMCLMNDRAIVVFHEIG